MGVVNVCDRCGRDGVDISDMHKIAITNIHTNKPSVRGVEICVWCKEKIAGFINNLEQEE